MFVIVINFKSVISDCSNNLLVVMEAFLYHYDVLLRLQTHKFP